MENKTQNKETAPQELQPEGINITTEAASLICEVISVCTKRGAFNPNELSVVGNLFDQISAQIPKKEIPTEEATEGNGEK